jgi:hypothetical protein
MRPVFFFEHYFMKKNPQGKTFLPLFTHDPTPSPRLKRCFQETYTASLDHSMRNQARHPRPKPQNLHNRRPDLPKTHHEKPLGDTTSTRAHETRAHACAKAPHPGGKGKESFPPLSPPATGSISILSRVLGSLGPFLHPPTPFSALVLVEQMSHLLTSMALHPCPSTRLRLPLSAATLPRRLRRRLGFRDLRRWRRLGLLRRGFPRLLALLRARSVEQRTIQRLLLQDFEGHTYIHTCIQTYTHTLCVQPDAE